MDTATALIIAASVALVAFAAVKVMKDVCWGAGYAQGYSDGREEGEPPEVYIPEYKQIRACAMEGMPYCLQCPDRREIAGEWVCTQEIQEGDKAMKQILKPMLFNTAMVKAILEDRKTTTRRVCKITINGSIPVDHTNCKIVEFPQKNFRGPCAEFFDRNKYFKGASQQRYFTGDILYIRETWKQATIDPAGGGFALQHIFLYKADEPIDTTGMLVEERWHPSIHMPKEAARIFLRVKNVRIERLQTPFFAERDKPITAILNEGMDIPNECKDCMGGYWKPSCNDDESECGILDDARNPFSELWDSTIKPKERSEYGWAANPWVWVIEFERITKDEALRATTRAGQE